MLFDFHGHIFNPDIQDADSPIPVRPRKLRDEIREVGVFLFLNVVALVEIFCLTVALAAVVRAGTDLQRLAVSLVKDDVDDVLLLKIGKQLLPIP